MAIKHLMFCALFYLGEVKCKSKVRRFPNNFQFGASTSAYQIEGGWYEDGKGLSIWDISVHSDPSPIKEGANGDTAADSYHLYKRDVEIAKEVDLDFYRFSISWPRILPNGLTDINQAGIDYYNNLINELLDNNIAPFVTMYHYDLPHFIQKIGGWTNPHIIDWFVNYAKILIEKFGDRVKYWITINDPKQICNEGYGSTNSAPMLNMSGIADYLCSKNVLLAHAKVYRLYDEYYRKMQNGNMGISISCTWYEPASDSKDDKQAAVDARQFDWGQYAHPIFSHAGDYPREFKKNVAFKSAEQGYPQSRLPELSVNDVTMLRNSSDFFGINTFTTKLTYRDASLEGMFDVPSYYDDMAVVMIKDHLWPQSQIPWLQEVPWGLYKLLIEIKVMYDNPPIYILENGWPTSGELLDDDRIRYIRGHLNVLLDAIDEGCNIKKYAVWSLIDSFEWIYGYTIKFGLYDVDFTIPERTRTPRKSAYIYKEITRTKTLDPNFEPENGTFESSVVKKKVRENEDDDGY